MSEWTETIDKISGSIRYHKTFDDGTDVILTAETIGNKVVIKSSVESRTSGPIITVLGEKYCLDEAYQLIKEHCTYWDTRQISALPNWRKWKMRRSGS